MPNVKTVQLRRWCFTIWDKDDGTPWEFPQVLPDRVSMMVAQREVGSENKAHWQGYVQMLSPTRMLGVKNALACNWAHLEGSVGSPEDNIRYCSKCCSECFENGKDYTDDQCSECDRIDGPYLLGRVNTQGKRNDLLDVALICVDYGLQAAIEHSPVMYIRYSRGIERYHWRVARWRRIARGYMPPKILVLCGATEAGKSRLVYDMYGYENVYDGCELSGNNGEGWWDGYEGQKVVLLEEFYGQLRYGKLLKLLDGYPNQVSTKGGHAMLENTVWCITSNKTPSEWYSHQTVKDQAALYNRLWSRFDSCVFDYGAGKEIPHPDSVPDYLATSAEVAAYEAPPPVTAPSLPGRAPENSMERALFRTDPAPAQALPEFFGSRVPPGVYDGCVAIVNGRHCTWRKRADGSWFPRFSNP